MLRLLKANQIRHFQGYTDDDESYIRKVVNLIEEGGLPRQTARTLARALDKEPNPLRILAKLKTNIAAEFFKEPLAEDMTQTSSKREVILSEYMVGTQK